MDKNTVDGYTGLLYLAIIRLGPYPTPLPGMQTLTRYMLRNSNNLLIHFSIRYSHKWENEAELGKYIYQEIVPSDKWWKDMKAALTGPCFLQV